MRKNNEIIEIIKENGLMYLDINTTIYDGSRLDKNLYFGGCVKFVEFRDRLYLVDCNNEGKMCYTLKELVCFDSLNSKNDRELKDILSALEVL